MLQTRAHFHSIFQTRHEMFVLFRHQTSNSDLQEIIVGNGEVSQTAETLLGGSGIANDIKQSHIIIILIFFYIIL